MNEHFIKYTPSAWNMMDKLGVIYLEAEQAKKLNMKIWDNEICNK